MAGSEAALENRVLHRHGKSIREIARETGTARNTMRRYLRDQEAGRYKARPSRPTKLDPFRANFGGKTLAPGYKTITRNALTPIN